MNALFILEGRKFHSSTGGTAYEEKHLLRLSFYYSLLLSRYATYHY
jgi:hypothetical protein